MRVGSLESPSGCSAEIGAGSPNLFQWRAPIQRRSKARGPPGQVPAAFVEEQLRDYLECGILCFGFARALCTGCRQGLSSPSSARDGACVRSAMAGTWCRPVHAARGVCTQPQALSGAGRDPRMSGSCELGHGLRRREKNANKAGAGRCEKPAPDARAAPPEAHESFISRKTVAVVPLTGLSFTPSCLPVAASFPTCRMQRQVTAAGRWPGSMSAPAPR